MLVLIKFLYITFLLPPGLFIAALTVCCWWLYKRKQKRAVRVLAIITALLYFISTPLVGDYLLRTLESRYTPPATADGDVIVIPGGGATADTPNVHGKGHLMGSAANRLLTATQLYYSTNLPIIISGGQVFANTGREAEIVRHILLGLGVPDNKIIMEGQALNTADNAKYVKEIIIERDFTRPVLVTSAFHMERSVINFHKENIDVVPYPTDYMVNKNHVFHYNKLAPSAGALYGNYIFLQEWLGILVAKII